MRRIWGYMLRGELVGRATDDERAHRKYLRRGRLGEVSRQVNRENTP